MSEWNEFLSQSVVFGMLVTFAAYAAGLRIRRRLRFALANPLLIAILLTICVLLALGVDYETYYGGAKYVGALLTPTTVCLAIPLYEQLSLLRDNAKAVAAGIVSGALTSAATVLLFAVCFHFSASEYATFLPKSVTTAIGIGISERLGGAVPVTAAAIILTGVMGNMSAEAVCGLFHITERVARGVAIGSSAHAIGTARALEMGEVEGAISGLSLVVSGVLTVAVAMVFEGLYP